MKIRSFRVKLVWPIAFLVLLTCGCGGGNTKTYPAGGVINFADGSPLAGGRVSFQLEGDSTAATAKGKIQPDGTFQLSTYAEGDGALAGNHRVLISPPRSRRDRNWEEKMVKRSESSDAQVAPRYYSFDTSGLAYTVTQDESKNHFEIRLEPSRSHIE